MSAAKGQGCDHELERHAVQFVVGYLKPRLSQSPRLLTTSTPESSSVHCRVARSFAKATRGRAVLLQGSHHRRADLNQDLEEIAPSLARTY